MAAETINDPACDPAAILRVLPGKYHEQFLIDYRGAIDAARDVRRFHELRDVLHRWRLCAIAFSNPDYEAALQDVRDRRWDRFVPAEEVIPGWPDQL